MWSESVKASVEGRVEEERMWTLNTAINHTHSDVLFQRFSRRPPDPRPSLPSNPVAVNAMASPRREEQANKLRSPVWRGSHAHVATSRRQVRIATGLQGHMTHITPAALLRYAAKKDSSCLFI